MIIVLTNNINICNIKPFSLINFLKKTKQVIIYLKFHRKKTLGSDVYSCLQWNV